MGADRIIRRMMNVKPRDTLPFKGWNHDKTRQDLHRIFARLDYTTGAEVGVAGGKHAKQMFEAIPGLHLLLVDPYKAYFRISQDICDRRLDKMQRRLESYNKTVMRTTSLEASQQVDDASLDFVYIDGDHRFDAVMMDIILWAPKVRKGGIVSGHDYFHFYQSGVVDAVRAYVTAHRVTDWYVTWEKEASWFWVQKEDHSK